MSVGQERNLLFFKSTGREKIHVRLKHSPRQHIDFDTEIGQFMKSLASVMEEKSWHMEGKKPLKVYRKE